MRMDQSGSPVSEYEHGGLVLHPAAIFRLVLVLSVASLLGRYFGGVWNILRVGLLLAPVLSLIYLAYVALGVRLVQDFSTDHPVKGGTVTYTLQLGNEAMLPFTGVTAELYLGRSHDGGELLSCVLLPGRTMTFHRTIICPFRGVYPVGLARLGVTDLTATVTIRLDVSHRVFYVTPRVLSVAPAMFQLSRDRPGSEQVQYGVGEDVTLFRELVEYREGEDARRILWRYMAMRNALLIPTYDRGVDIGLRVLLDTRRSTGDGEARAVEDCSLEIVLAIVQASLRIRVPVSVAGFGIEPVLFTPENPDSLHQFVSTTIGMFFDSHASPVDYESPAGLLSSAPVVYVTHQRDDAILETIMDAPAGTCGLILNTSGLPVNEASSLHRFAESMQQDRKLCHAVRSADELAEPV